MKYLLALIALLPLLTRSQSIQPRTYHKGDIFYYQLITATVRNDQPEGRTISVSQHRVVEDSGRLVEEITWKKKTVYSKKDTLDLDAAAQKVLPYKISLVNKNDLKLPPLVIPEMTGEITDLNTFYVAASPALHIQRLSSELSFFKDSTLHGKFADGIQILKGEDLIEVTQKLISQDKNISIIETSFTPPEQPGLTPLSDTIGKQLFDHPNNFQMVRKGTGDKVNLLWGVEEFIITTTLDNASGQILAADMINTLHLRMRFNATQDLKTYDAEIPLLIKRILHLKLMSR